MPGIHDLALFVASGVLLNLTPGADTLYIVAWSSAGFGRRMRGLPGRLQILRRVSGLVFVALGVKLALSARDAA